MDTERKKCSVESCSFGVSARGMCSYHYKKWHKKQPKGSCSKREVSEIRIEGDTAHIELTQGKFALIDVEDIYKVSGYVWHYMHPGYAVYKEKGTRKTVLMHRVITNADDAAVIDHIDRNPLNNKKSNLRETSQLENIRNSKLCDNAKGVWFLERTGRWRAKLNYSMESVHLGYFDSEQEALEAYKEAVALTEPRVPFPAFIDRLCAAGIGRFAKL